MLRKPAALVLLAAILPVAVVWAAIPEPDVVLYGGVQINGMPVTVYDDVTVFATLGTATDPQVGSYHLGDIPEAGDRHVLRIRLESLADGSDPSSNAARIGETVNIYGRMGAGAAELLAAFDICDRAIIRPFNLPYMDDGVPDSDYDGDVDQHDFAHLEACISGPGAPQNGLTCQCAGMDLDSDDDVDLVDFGILQRCYSGDGNPTAPGCAN